MPTVAENLAWGRAQNWEDHGEEWSSGWGDSVQMWHSVILPRITRDLVLGETTALEIACGHGRCTRFLAPIVKNLTACDLAPECVSTTQSRLSGFSNISYFVTDGKSLDGVANESLDFAFSWDSLVHAEEDALAGYVEALATKLKPGGRAFLHHSNLAAYLPAHTPSHETPHWRAASMSAEKMRAMCERFGLVCYTQELIPWGADPNHFIDAFSRIGRPAPGEAPVATQIDEHHDFLVEAKAGKRLQRLYASAPDLRVPNSRNAVADRVGKMLSMALNAAGNETLNKKVDRLLVNVDRYLPKLQRAIKTVRNNQG